MIKDDKLPLKEKYLKYYSELPNQGLAADSIGRNEDTIILWKKEDSEFSDLCAKAKSDWALNKSKRIRNEEWLLERVMNDHFGQKIKTDLNVKSLKGLIDVKENDKFEQLADDSQKG